MAAKGYVYVLRNDLMQGVYKVGMTTGSPFERAAQLSSSTGVPADFDVIYVAKVANPRDVEAHAHAFFSEERVSRKKEFFAADPRHISSFIGCFAIKEWSGRQFFRVIRTGRLAQAAGEGVKCQK